MARPKKGITFYDRVWSQTTIDPKTGCWEFNGPHDDHGYGRIHRNAGLVRIHREVWQDLHGPLRKDQHVCHRCDNPPCFNPEHLFVGSHADNMRDKARKGRVVYTPFAKGDRNPQSKLLERDVRSIKRRLESRESHTAIARDFPVSRSTISMIATGKVWAHIG